MKEMMAYIVLIAVCGVVKIAEGAHNCANNAGDKYSLTLTGNTTITEGGALTFTITTDPVGTTLDNPVWEVKETGSRTEILKHSDGSDASYVITPSQNGLSAAVVFYWYPGGTPGKYLVTFKSGGTGTECSKTKTVTVSLPSPGGITRVTESPVVDTTLKDNNTKVLIGGMKNCHTAAESPYVVCVQTSSPFYNKIDKHEKSHYDDYAGVTGDAEQEALLYLNTWLDDNNYKGTTISILEYGAMMRKLRKALDVHLDPWDEGRAYTISDDIDPKYFYQTSGVD